MNDTDHTVLIIVLRNYNYIKYKQPQDEQNIVTCVQHAQALFYSNMSSVYIPSCIALNIRQGIY